MNIKAVIFLTLLMCSSACVLLKDNQKKEARLTGIVSATKHTIPVLSQLEFYVGSKLIAKTQTDNTGRYSIAVHNKYIGKECSVVATPIKDIAEKDIMNGNDVVSIIQARNLKTDTLFVVLHDSLVNIPLTKFVYLEIDKILSD